VLVDVDHGLNPVAQVKFGQNPETWVLTVCSPTYSTAAISAFE
jgi:hypothetical protein